MTATPLIPRSVESGGHTPEETRRWQEGGRQFMQVYPKLLPLDDYVHQVPDLESIPVTELAELAFVFLGERPASMSGIGACHPQTMRECGLHNCGQYTYAPEKILALWEAYPDIFKKYRDRDPVQAIPELLGQEHKNANREIGLILGYPLAAVERFARKCLDMAIIRKHAETVRISRDQDAGASFYSRLFTNRGSKGMAALQEEYPEVHITAEELEILGMRNTATWIEVMHGIGWLDFGSDLEASHAQQARWKAAFELSGLSDFFEQMVPVEARRKIRSRLTRCIEPPETSSSANRV